MAMAVMVTLPVFFTVKVNETTSPAAAKLAVGEALITDSDGEAVTGTTTVLEPTGGVRLPLGCVPTTDAVF